MEHAAKRPRTSRFLTLCALDSFLPLEKKKNQKKRKKQMKKEKKRRKERSKQTNKKSHHHSDKSVHYYCVCFIWGMLAHPSGAKVALWDQLGPWQRDQLALKNTDIFSFGDDSYQCHRKEQKRHSTPPLIHSFCSQMSMSNSYHLITISETDLIRTNLQQVYTFNDKITFFGTLVTSLQHVCA